jgi:hypothetical protein
MLQYRSTPKNIIKTTKFQNIFNIRHTYKSETEQNKRKQNEIS